MEWKAVKGYEGAYEVSDQGEIKSLPRRTHFTTKAGVVSSILVKGKVLKQWIDKVGRPCVHLSVNGVSQVCRVSRIVATAFLEESKEGQIVCHGPLGCGVNTVDNLRWDTYKANTADRQRETPVRGSKIGNSKLTEDQIPLIHEAYASGETQVSIAKRLGMTQGTIGKIIRGEIWGHLCEPRKS